MIIQIKNSPKFRTTIITFNAGIFAFFCVFHMSFETRISCKFLMTFWALKFTNSINILKYLFFM